FSATIKLDFVRVLGSKNKFAANNCFVIRTSSFLKACAISNKSMISFALISVVVIKCFIIYTPYLIKKTSLRKVAKRYTYRFIIYVSIIRHLSILSGFFYRTIHFDISFFYFTYLILLF